MRSICKFAYAAVLGMSMFSLQPTLAAAEDAHGSFTLTHEVHWQKCVLGPGDYTFSIKSEGPFEFLMLRGINGTGTNAMMLVNDVESPKPDEVSAMLTLVSRNGQRFVSTMALPEYDMTLHFTVPRESESREIASK
jgi:hypothetical protein